MEVVLTTGSVNLVNSVRLKLLGCKTKEEVESVFSRDCISDTAVKTKFLHIAMQLEATYNTPSDGIIPNDEEIYEYYLKLFLDGKWKDFT